MGGHENGCPYFHRKVSHERSDSKVLGQEIIVQYVPEKGFIRYGKNSIKDWLIKDGFDEEEVEKDLKNKKDFFTSKQTYSYLKENYTVKEYREKFNWLKKKVEPEILKLMKKIPNGTQLRILNGLVVREHPEMKGLYSLTDAWKAAKDLFSKENSWKSKKPIIWKRDNKSTIEKLKKEISQSEEFLTLRKSDLIVSINGGTSDKRGTYANPRLLIAYTEFVHPRLHNKVLKVFEDYENGKLHTEETVNRRAKGTQARIDGRESFKAFAEHTKNVRGNTPHCTSKILYELFGESKTKKMKNDSIKEPFRDNISVEEHLKISLAENMSRMLYVKYNVQGHLEAEKACVQASSMINDLENKAEENAEIFRKNVESLKDGSNVIEFKSKKSNKNRFSTNKANAGEK